jgi:cation/acetate symporter
VASLALIAVSPTIMVDPLGAEAAWFPLKNPALVTIPLGFAAGVLVSLLAPEAAARDAYDAKERRMIMGVE